MFFIVNTTKKPIVIADINITLGPRQASDLDKRVDRQAADRSKDLHNAVRAGIVQVRRKDKVQYFNAEIEKDTKIEELAKMKDELLASMKETIKESLPQNQGITKDDLLEIAKQMASLVPQNTNTTNTVVIRDGEKKVSDEEEVEVSEVDLVDIHKRAVDKLAKGTDVSHVIYHEEKTKNTIDSNISELEDLLG